MTFGEAAARIAEILRGSARKEIVDALASRGEPVAQLRRAMRSHSFHAARGTVSLRSVVDTLDARTKREGLHVLQGWDFVEHHFTDEIVPVVLLDYCARNGAAKLDDTHSLALLLDQYFLAVLSLLSVRVWDDGDANANLDTLGALIADLQGPDGAGEAFVDDAETLLMLAVSYYHPQEDAYDLVLAKVRTLDAAHRLRYALPCAQIMASHLRWGLRFMYRRDAGGMRNDNVVDYPWLLFALLMLMREYAAPTGALPRERTIEGLLDGLSADPWAFTGNAPAFLETMRAEHGELRALLAEHAPQLRKDFAQMAPDSKRYSPLSFACNFISNASVAKVVLALGNSGAPLPSLNVLLSRESGTAGESLARALMEYSQQPERLGAGRAPLVVYDPYDGAHAYNAVIKELI